MPSDGWHHCHDGGAFDSVETPEAKSRSGDETARVAERNDRGGFSIANQRDGAHDRSIFLPANGGERVVLHREHLRGVDDFDARVGAALLLERGGYFPFSTDEEKFFDAFIAGGLEGSFDAGHDDPVTVVAAHDVNSYSHKNNKSAERNTHPRSVGKANYAPALMVTTWRPL